MGAGQDVGTDVYGFAKTLDFGRIQRATRGPGTATITAVRIRSPARIDVIALLLALTAALIARALVQVRLREAGLAEPVASDLAYLVVPLILAILSLPVLSKHRHFIAALFSTRPLTLRVVVAAIVVGLLFRVATGSLLVARIAFGWQVNDDPAAIEGPLLHIQCPPVASMLLGLAVSSILIPLIEELVHRGFVQTFLHRHGAFISVGASAMAIRRISSGLRAAVCVCRRRPARRDVPAFRLLVAADHCSRRHQPGTAVHVAMHEPPMEPAGRLVATVGARAGGQLPVRARPVQRPVAPPGNNQVPDPVEPGTCQSQRVSHALNDM